MTFLYNERFVKSIHGIMISNCEVICLRELYVNQNDADQRVDKFLMKALPNLPKSLMYQYIRKKKIKVNQKRCDIAMRLQEGDRLQCYIRDEFFEQSRRDHSFLQVSGKLDIVYEDEQILIAYKKAGILSQKDQKGIQDNMNDRLLHYLYQRTLYDPNIEQSFVPAFAHRLDRNTEGLMIAGKTSASLRCLNELIKTHRLQKEYLALVQGRCEKASDDLWFYYQKDHQRNRAELYDHPKAGATPVHTSYQVLEMNADHTLLNVKLHTGKSHQIRAVFAKLGHPLLGDQKYHGTQGWEYPYQALCAYRLQFDDHITGCLSYLSNQAFTLKQGDLLTYLSKHLSKHK